MQCFSTLVLRLVLSYRPLVILGAAGMVSSWLNFLWYGFFVSLGLWGLFGLFSKTKLSRICRRVSELCFCLLLVTVALKIFMAT